MNDEGNPTTPNYEDIERDRMAKEMMDDLIEKANYYLSSASSNKVLKTADGGKRRMTEKEEDERLMTHNFDQEMPTNLTAQPPNIVGGTMRPYQIEGLNWLVRLYHKGVSGILADEMGLGKTLQSISMVAYLKFFNPRPCKTLVIVPLSTLGNWMREFGRWCPSLNVIKFHGSKEARNDILRNIIQPGKFEVICTSYEMTHMGKSYLKKVDWEFIIIDEAHRIKNENSLLAKIVRTFPSRHRLLLTGTPLQNNLHELWALLNYLLPTLFTSSEEFDAMFAPEGMKDQVLKSLHKILRPFMLRRLKKDVEKSLLPKKEMMICVGMSALQRHVYQSVMSKDLDVVNGSCNQHKRLLNVVMQLRKAANHPYLFDGVEDRSLDPFGEHLIEASGKLVVLDKLLRKLMENGSRVLIFSQMTRVLDILEDYCTIRQYDFCRIDGSTKQMDREEYMADFNEPGSDKFIFLLSTRAGGLGINLQTADIVIIFDSDWNPQMDLQAQDRAHRIGQKKQVFVYRFVTEYTVELKIIQRARMKLHLDAMVIQRGRLSHKNQKVSKNELLDMIRYGADQVFQAKNSTITDEDIDIILSKGEAKTSEMEDRVKDRLSSIDTFSFDGRLPVDEGIGKPVIDDYSFVSAVAESLGKRERKTKLACYDVNEYYKGTTVKNKKRVLVPRRIKLPKMADFQLFQKDRIEYLGDKLYQWQLDHQFDDELPEGNGLSEEENLEFQTLIHEGFNRWTRVDFRAYVKQCERFGRNSEKIFHHVEGKSPDQVRAYHKMFWLRIKQIAYWERIIKNIERGESKIAKNAALEKFLEDIFSNYPTREKAKELTFNYKSGQRDKGYTKEEDCFLLYNSWKNGYGDWQALKEYCCNDNEFQFSYFLKSRTSTELGRRVDVLLRLKQLEKKQKAKEKLKRELKAKEKLKAKEEKLKAKEEKKQNGKITSMNGVFKTKNSKMSTKNTTLFAINGEMTKNSKIITKNGEITTNGKFTEHGALLTKNNIATKNGVSTTVNGEITKNIKTKICDITKNGEVNITDQVPTINKQEKRKREEMIEANGIKGIKSREIDVETDKEPKHKKLKTWATNNTHITILDE